MGGGWDRRKGGGDALTLGSFPLRIAWKNNVLTEQLRDFALHLPQAPLLAAVSDPHAVISSWSSSETRSLCKWCFYSISDCPPFLCFSPRAPVFGWRVWDRNHWQQGVIKTHTLHLVLQVFSGPLSTPSPIGNFSSDVRGGLLHKHSSSSLQRKFQVAYRFHFNAFLFAQSFIWLRQVPTKSQSSKVKTPTKLNVKQMSFYRHNFVFDTCQ